MFKRVSLSVVFIFLLACAAVNASLKFDPSIVDIAIIRVPEEYPTIQAAVNAASSGDMILVASGVYHENVVVNKSVRIVGEDSISTVVEGAGGFSYTILIIADMVEINSLTAKNGQAGIFINHSSRCNIYGNIVISNTYFGGIVLSYSNANTIAYNKALNNGGGDPPLQYGVGIALSYSNSNIISSNTVRRNIVSGLTFYQSHGNIVINNTVNENKVGIGIDYYSTQNIVSGNSVILNKEVGIGMTHASNNTVESNRLVANGIHSSYSTMNFIKGNTVLNSSYVGIDIGEESTNNFVFDNTFYNNNIGVRIHFSNFSFFYHNNFVNNGNNHPQDVYYNINFWNNSFGEGNFWSNYTGIDANRDGIGDTPHVLYTNNQDYHPLMSPYIPADCNHDGIVNIKDVNLVGIAWNTTKSMPKYNPHADLNMDNTINTADADILRKNWQKTFQPP